VKNILSILFVIYKYIRGSHSWYHVLPCRVRVDLLRRWYHELPCPVRVNLLSRSWQGNSFLLFFVTGGCLPVPVQVVVAFLFRVERPVPVLVSIGSRENRRFVSWLMTSKSVGNHVISGESFFVNDVVDISVVFSGPFPVAAVLGLFSIFRCKWRECCLDWLDKVQVNSLKEKLSALEVGGHVCKFGL